MLLWQDNKVLLVKTGVTLTHKYFWRGQVGMLQTAQIFFLALLVVLCLPANARATASIPCLLDDSGGPASPGMTNCPAAPIYGDQMTLANTGYPAARSNAGVVAHTPIYAYNLCRYVDNASSLSLLVPFNSSTEWYSFHKRYEPTIYDITLTHCAFPYNGEDDDTSFRLYYGPTSALPQDTPSVTKAPVSLPYWRTADIWPPGGKDVDGVNTHTFNYTCTRPVSIPYCYQEGTCTGCSASNPDGTCAQSYTYSCCVNSGTMCSTTSRGWTEIWDFIGTALDGDTTLPSWTGRSTQIGGTTRPNDFCCGSCTQTGTSCNCDYSACPNQPPACGTSSGSCAVGTASGVTQVNGGSLWSCSSGSTTVSCSAASPVAACGTDYIVKYNGAPYSGTACASGDTASAVNLKTGAYTCSIGSGDDLSSVSCTAQIRGRCGADNGLTLTSNPTSLCIAGDTASVVTKTSTGWSWTCAYSDDSSQAASCSATLQPAECGTSPVVDSSGALLGGSLCADGTASSVDTANGSYTCSSGGGKNLNTKTCAATVLQPPQCSSNVVLNQSGGYFSALCATGTASSLMASNGVVSYTCTVGSGGSSISTTCRPFLSCTTWMSQESDHDCCYLFPGYKAISSTTGWCGDEGKQTGCYYSAVCSHP